VLKIEQLKLIIEAWGMNLNEILSREAITRVNMTIIDIQHEQIETFNQA